jgi:hypothetical protein
MIVAGGHRNKKKLDNARPVMSFVRKTTSRMHKINFAPAGMKTMSGRNRDGSYENLNDIGACAN